MEQAAGEVAPPYDFHAALAAIPTDFRRVVLTMTGCGQDEQDSAKVLTERLGGHYVDSTVASFSPDVNHILVGRSQDNAPSLLQYLLCRFDPSRPPPLSQEELTDVTTHFPQARQALHAAADGHQTTAESQGWSLAVSSIGLGNEVRVVGGPNPESSVGRPIAYAELQWTRQGEVKRQVVVVYHSSWLDDCIERDQYGTGCPLFLPDPTCPILCKLFTKHRKEQIRRDRFAELLHPQLPDEALIQELLRDPHAVLMRTLCTLAPPTGKRKKHKMKKKKKERKRDSADDERDSGSESRRRKRRRAADAADEHMGDGEGDREDEYEGQDLFGPRVDERPVTAVEAEFDRPVDQLDVFAVGHRVEVFSGRNTIVPITGTIADVSVGEDGRVIQYHVHLDGHSVPFWERPQAVRTPGTWTSLLQQDAGRGRRGKRAARARIHDDMHDDMSFFAPRAHSHQAPSHQPHSSHREPRDSSPRPSRPSPTAADGPEEHMSDGDGPAADDKDDGDRHRQQQQQHVEEAKEEGMAGGGEGEEYQLPSGEQPSASGAAAGPQERADQQPGDPDGEQQAPDGLQDVAAAGASDGVRLEAAARQEDIARQLEERRMQWLHRFDREAQENKTEMMHQTPHNDMPASGAACDDAVPPPTARPDERNDCESPRQEAAAASADRPHDEGDAADAPGDQPGTAMPQASPEGMPREPDAEAADGCGVDEAAVASAREGTEDLSQDAAADPPADQRATAQGGDAAAAADDASQADHPMPAKDMEPDAEVNVPPNTATDPHQQTTNAIARARDQHRGASDHEQRENEAASSLSPPSTSPRDQPSVRQPQPSPSQSSGQSAVVGRRGAKGKVKVKEIDKVELRSLVVQKFGPIENADMQSETLVVQQLKGQWLGANGDVVHPTTTLIIDTAYFSNSRDLVQQALKRCIPVIKLGKDNNYLQQCCRKKRLLPINLFCDNELTKWRKRGESYGDVDHAKAMAAFQAEERRRMAMAVDG
ncbi:unnamed protein product [Vitrella brassicaformis CCMP3155]|uniref:BRCT domain-containing protein n=1 Tax=Vitrella brassicaformis (strain CCMP3155) TaxID=1169540 RepID=A0A0G4F9K2_VITBC|nr:unnamed protein product [Vitrella brassicaformis CCMP3155]|eukprot:CEM08933.1 unnamed protein product [Vitrella brassicaformis CCMP3155]